MIQKQLIFLLLLAGVSSCGENENTKEKQESQEVKDTTTIEVSVGINPPAPQLDVPYKKVTMNAEEGGVFVSKYGSIITFPENAVLYEDGTPVTGQFDVEYREFQDPLAIYFAGIPMGYDSAGVNYNFVSAGMFDLNAKQNGKQLKVNPAAMPDVSLVSKDADPRHNLYYYDQTTNQWTPEGKAAIEEFKQPENNAKTKSVVPNKPVKKSADKHSFKVAIDKSQVAMSEFDGFDQMEFQIADQEKNYLPSDSKIHWNGVKVEKSPKYKGKYLVTFTAANMTKTYLTDPVFSAADYAKAMEIYESKMKLKEMDKVLNKAAEALYIKKQEAILAQNKIIDSINKVVLANNARLQQYNDSMDANTAILLQQNGMAGTRGVAVNRFGTWNCDIPMSLEILYAAGGSGSAPSNLTEVDFRTFVEFKDNDGQPFSVIYSNVNTVFNKSLDYFKNIPNAQEILFKINKNTLSYCIIADDLAKQVTPELIPIDITNLNFEQVKAKLLLER